MLSKQALEDFKQIWREEYGEEISDEFAVQRASGLLALFDAIYKPLKKAWVDESDNNLKETHEN